jgi:hypothetical protein
VTRVGSNPRPLSFTAKVTCDPLRERTTDTVLARVLGNIRQSFLRNMEQPGRLALCEAQIAFRLDLQICLDEGVGTKHPDQLE